MCLRHQLVKDGKHILPIQNDQFKCADCQHLFVSRRGATSKIQLHMIDDEIHLQNRQLTDHFRTS